MYCIKVVDMNQSLDETDDSVGQMTMMAKSRMHDELITKARARTEAGLKDSGYQATPRTPPPSCPPPKLASEYG